MINAIKLYLVILLELTYASALAAFLTAGIVFPVVGFLLAPFAILYGLFLGAPAISLGAFICYFLERNDLKNKSYFMFSGAVTGVVYVGVLALFLKTQIFMLLYFFIGGFLSGWIYWRNRYLEKKGFRIF